jgi:hypothetical protein
MQSEPVNQVHRHPSQAVILITGLLTILLFSGCIPIAFSPEAAATREALRQKFPDAVIDPGSLQLLQKLEMNGSNLVLISFEQNRAKSGRESCLFLYNVQKTRLGGFMPASSGGSCSNGILDPAVSPMTSGGNSSSGNGNNDPGYSAANGQVLRDDIEIVQVTWSDDTTQQVDVINKSYIAARTGLFEMKKVEGLSADKRVLYSNEFHVDPNKK